MSRSVLFVGWSCVGLVWSYAAVYIVTRFGLTTAAGGAVVAVALHVAGRAPRWEMIGLVAGAGALFLVAATGAPDPGAALPIGVALVVGAVIAFGVATRRTAHRL